MTKYQPSTPIPFFRKDIQLHQTLYNGTQQIYVYDTFEYAEDGIYLTYDAFNVVQMFNNNTTVQELAVRIFRETPSEEEITFLIDFIEQIDRFGYLESEKFEVLKREKLKVYTEQDVRLPVCSGGSYSSDPKELSEYIGGLINTSTIKEENNDALGIIVPHIDYRVGAASYAPAFKALEKSDAKVAVIFATSHYWFGDRFILTEKDFSTPLGRVSTDKQIIRRIRELYSHPLTQNDMAHKPEHSIELELPFLQYVWKDKDFTIVPILVTSFHDYMEKNILPKEDESIKDFIEAVKKAVEESGKKAIYISSGDLAHIGRKFGDDYDAVSKLDEVHSADMHLLRSLAECKSDEFFKQITSVQDKWKVCGCSPNYMLLETLQPNKGVIVDYKQWDERERASGVTFGTVVYY